MSDDTTSITKLMAATPNEFARGMERLTADMSHRNINGQTEIHLPNGTVTVSYVAKEGRRLSPLLVMPAADVTLAFKDVPEPERKAFVAKFDLVFQRGGG